MLDLTIAELETLKKMLEPRKDETEISLLYFKIIQALKEKLERKLKK